MEGMDKKICLDTDVLIFALKNIAYYELIERNFSDYTFYTTTITIFELYQRETNLHKIDALIANFTVLDFDAHAAATASGIFKHLRAKGILVEIKDLFIASVALSNDCELLTNNIKNFKNIPKLKLVGIDGETKE